MNKRPTKTTLKKKTVTQLLTNTEPVLCVETVNYFLNQKSWNKLNINVIIQEFYSGLKGLTHEFVSSNVGTKKAKSEETIISGHQCNASMYVVTLILGTRINANYFPNYYKMQRSTSQKRMLVDRLLHIQNIKIDHSVAVINNYQSTFNFYSCRLSSVGSLPVLLRTQILLQKPVFVQTEKTFFRRGLTTSKYIQALLGYAMSRCS